MWSSSLAHSVRAALKVERVFSDPWAIARGILGVLAASVLGWVLDDPLAWAMMTVGTFITGIGTLLAPTRHRIVNAAATGACFSLATLVGVYAQPTGWWFLLVLFAASYLAGLWRALGVAPGIRACLVVIGLMITADLSPGTAGGLEMVKWIAAGAGIVLCAQLLPPYGRRHPAQRKAVAGVYAALAGHARGAAASDASLAAAASGTSGYLSSAPFTAARGALDLLPEFARPAAAPLFALLAEGERIRRAVTTSAGTAGTPLAAIADLLDGIGRTVLTARPHPVSTETRTALDDWRGPAADALLPRLREAERLTAHWLEARGRRASAGFEGLDEVLAAFPARSAARTALRRLRAELRPGAPLFSHAVRIAVGTVAAEAAGRALGDFWGEALPHHGFWAALTAMLVLFPDYGHTFARGWARPIGSIIGGIAAWALLLPHFWTPGWVVVASVVLAALVYLTLRTSQWVLNIFITAWIVFLISRLGSAPDLIAFGRPADTVLGSLVALAVFVLLPTYHHRRMPGLLAEWLRVQQVLLPGLVAGYAEADSVDTAEIDRLRDRARALRELMDAGIASLAHEPRRHRARWSPQQLTGIQQAVFGVGRAGALLYEQRPLREEDAVPEAAEFAPVLRGYLGGLAEALASGEPARPGALRSAFDASAARSGLADLTDPSSPDLVSHSRARALTATLTAVGAVEELTARCYGAAGSGGAGASPRAGADAAAGAGAGAGAGVGQESAARAAGSVRA